MTTKSKRAAKDQMGNNADDLIETIVTSKQFFKSKNKKNETNRNDC